MKFIAAIVISGKKNTYNSIFTNINSPHGTNNMQGSNERVNYET